MIEWLHKGSHYYESSDELWSIRRQAFPRKPEEEYVLIRYANPRHVRPYRGKTIGQFASLDEAKEYAEGILSEEGSEEVPA